jgi:uncharacterized membrane protein YeiB
MSYAEQTASAGCGPVRAADRALAPDVARGAMLLFIALANASGVVFGGPGTEPDPVGIECALNLVMVTAVHARAYPVFAVMFGYGLVQLARRQEAAGAAPAAARAILLRRSLWLVVFGALHALLLYYGDFLGAYGLIGAAAVLVLLRRGDRVLGLVLWVWAFTVLEVFVIGAVVTARLMDGSGEWAPIPAVAVASLTAPDYLSALRARLIEWPAHTLTVLPAIVIVWLGMWAARRRLLEDLAGRERFLRRVAVVGLGVAYAGGLPLALASAGLLRANASAMEAMVLLHQGSGMFGGPGYAAVAGLGALALSRGTPPAASTRMAGLMAALGRRSLSGYLFQSVAWLLLLSPYTLALATRFPSPMLAGLVTAVFVWLASLVWAGALDRAARPGPAEAILRRLIYRPAVVPTAARIT